jgi:hypothetical protein
MPMVGNKKYPYTEKGKAAAMADSKKSGKPMKKAAKKVAKKKTARRGLFGAK